MFFRMEIEKVLNNSRLVRAVLGVTKQEFNELLDTFTQVLIEYRTQTPRKRALGGGAINPSHNYPPCEHTVPVVHQKTTVQEMVSFEWSEGRIEHSF
jgi:hypothetical protein